MIIKKETKPAHAADTVEPVSHNGQIAPEIRPGTAVYEVALLMQKREHAASK